MKKRVKSIFFVLSILIASMFIVSQARAETIWAFELPVWSTPFEWLDHTYACVGSYNNCFTCPANAGKSGGDLAELGNGNSCLAECFAFCRLDYGSNGVCHQHTNRVLFPTGKTLPSSVKGYNLSVSFWGTHGTSEPAEGQFYVCYAICSANCN